MQRHLESGLVLGGLIDQDIDPETEGCPAQHAAQCFGVVSRCAESGHAVALLIILANPDEQRVTRRQCRRCHRQHRRHDRGSQANADPTPAKQPSMHRHATRNDGIGELVNPPFQTRHRTPLRIKG